MSATNNKDATDQQPLTNAQIYEKSVKTGASFDINNLKYPDNVGTDEFKHWISFSINVRGKSTIRLGNENIVTEVRRPPDTAQLTEDDLATASELALTAGGAAAGAAAGAIVSDFFGKFKGKNTKTGSGPLASLLKKAAPIVAGGAAGNYLSSKDFLKPDTSFRISDVINLYVDGPPTVRYNSQYSNRDLGTIAGLAGGGIDAIGSSAGALEAGSAIAMKFAQIPQLAGVNTADIVGASAKVALNPFKEVLFEAIDFRAFTFKYKFMPKNKKEADDVYKIIEIFKFHMHPELSANKLFFIYPSEFQISYHFYNKVNNKDGGGYFHKFKPCVLETMDVTYGGDQFSTFVDGKPTEINMALTFRETEILTKAQIKDGF